MICRQLRYGNFVMTGKVESVAFEICASGITHDSLSRDIVAGHCEWSHVEPIPLTEEWLVKFGFVETVSASGLFYNVNIGVEKDGGGWSWSFRQVHIELGKRTSTFYHHILQIQYVHQLQNLYFALTGEELTLKQ